MTPSDVGTHFARYRPELLQAARKWLKTRYSGLREDAVQDAMIAALEAPDRYPDLDALKGLVELHAFLLFVRQRAIDRREPPVHAWTQGGKRLVQYDAEGEPPLDPVDFLADLGPSPEDLAVASLTTTEVAAIGSRLTRHGATPEQQALFTLAYMEGRSPAEIAEFLGVTYNAAALRLQRLRRLLRRVVPKRG